LDDQFHLRGRHGLAVMGLAVMSPAVICLVASGWGGTY
jgi:hypothetical protein